jgi:lysophospholipase L1-like esterase
MFVVVIAIVVLSSLVYFGNERINTISENAKNSSALSWGEMKKLAEQKEIEKWKPNGSPRSYIDDLQYYIARNGSVKISTLGSSVTAGDGATSKDKSWAGLLKSYLRNTDGLFKTEVISNGFPGYSSQTILSENKVDVVIAEKPDVVLFETSILNDHGQSVPIDKTLQNINTVVEKLRTSLPESKIIILSPNPKASDKKNSVGLMLADYAVKTKELASQKGWDYIDVYNGFLLKNADLNHVLTDGVHPNDEGYKIWFEIMKSEFEKKK